MTLNRKRYAFLLGNDAYSAGKAWPSLPCVRRDVDSFASALESLGFVVRAAANLNRASMYEYFAELDDLEAPAEALLVYYAGHGIALEKTDESFLVPIDAGAPDGDSSVKADCYPVSELLRSLENAPADVRLLFFDACRSYSNDGTRGVSASGIGAVYGPRGSLVSYASSPGSAAYESPDLGHSYYMHALLNSIKLPRLSVENMLKQVRREVYELSEGKQVTWEHSSLIGEFSFNPGELIEYSSYAPGSYSADYRLDSAEANQLRELMYADWGSKRANYPKLIAWLKEEGDRLAADELFKVGRVIGYAVADGFYEAQRWFGRFVTSCAAIANDCQLHILNGIAHELYCLPSGRLRPQFDLAQMGVLISLLETEGFGPSCGYVQSLIREKAADRFIYVPAETGWVDVSVEVANQAEGQPSNDWQVRQVLINGRGVRSSHADIHPFLSEGSVETTKQILGEGIGAPKNNIRVEFSDDVGAMALLSGLAEPVIA